MGPDRVTTAVAGALTAIVLAASLLVAGPGAAGAEPRPAPTSPPDALGETVRPLLDQRGAADPTVVQVGTTWVALSTGRSVPRATAPSPNGPWTDTGAALLTLPTWATSDRIWASDLVQTDAGWVLYFSATVSGLGSDGRCIGAAFAASPLDAFVPEQRPVVCPRRAATPPAYDVVRPQGRSLPRRTGVIDPEGWVDRVGRRWLLYRTQGQPSTIRMVRVPRGGRATTGRRASVEVVRSAGVIENPVLVQRGRRVVLLTSEGDFGGCGYETTWRKARSVEGLARARKRVLLDTTRTGLCGPGGADLAAGTADGLLYLHAWSCRTILYHCPAGPDYDRAPSLGAHRAMFAANLAWSSSGVPRVVGWVAPLTDPWAPPVAPTPAPSPTPAPTATATPTPATS